jgi:hypothetical protein
MRIATLFSGSTMANNPATNPESRPVGGAMTDHGNTNPEETMDKYSVTIDGESWRFNGTGWVSGFVRWATPTRTHSLFTALTPAQLRAIADVQERWERDHTPKRQVRLRVVLGTAKWLRSAAEYVQFQAWANDDGVRASRELMREWCIITNSDLTAILDLRDHGAWEESLDGGATWTPTHRGPDDD